MFQQVFDSEGFQEISSSPSITFVLTVTVSYLDSLVLEEVDYDLHNSYMLLSFASQGVDQPQVLYF